MLERFIKIKPLNKDMKRALYSLADEEFVTLLARTDSAFQEAKMPYMFVGGVATQAHIANYLCKENNKTILDLVESSDFRIQDYLRATDDVDITIDPRNSDNEIEVGKKVLYVLDDIVGKEGTFMSISGDHLVCIDLQRKGIKRPLFRLGLDKEANNPERVASFNFYFGPEDTNDRWNNDIREFEKQYYFDFMDKGTQINIPYCPQKNIVLKVKKVEDLITTKIIKGREKDWTDILSLVKHSKNAGMPVDYKKIEEMLCNDKNEYQKPNLNFVEKFEKFNKVIKDFGYE